MKIELKNFKHAAFASEETLCFSATVYVDGQRMFEASNSGKGEYTRIEPLKGHSAADLKRVSDWVAKQPKIKIQGDEVDDDIEFYINRLADREVARKELKKLLKKSVFLCETGADKNGLTQLAMKAGDLNDINRSRIMASFPNCVIVNDLNIEKALDLYLATAVA